MRVLITGCSSGFGLGTARLLARRGHEVIATVRNPAASTELRKLRDSGLPIKIEALDVRNEAQARSVIERTIDAGGLDALVNKAGASIFGPVEATSLNQMRDLMEVNLLGAMRLIQLVLPHMRLRKQGRIVNVSSLSGIICLPYVGLYGATKHALDALSLSLAAEVRDFGIWVTILSPSGFRTQITDKLWAPEGPFEDPVYSARTKIVRDRMTTRLDNDPAPVFEAITATLESPHPPIRQLVGSNAQELAHMYRSASDEAWFDFMDAFQRP